MEKYVAGDVFMEMELAMFNDIRQSGEMPAMLRDVIITVLYKGKGLRDNCDSYRGISLMSHKEKLLERLILNRLKPALRVLYQRFNLALRKNVAHRMPY